MLTSGLISMLASLSLGPMAPENPRSSRWKEDEEEEEEEGEVEDEEES